MQRPIRIGTLVPGHPDAADYIRQIAGHGFESFSITFGPSLQDKKLVEVADSVRRTIGDRDIVISSVAVYGNPLGERPEDQDTVRSWEQLIDGAHLFGADVVAGFAGRVVDRPVPESMPSFRKVFGELAKRAEDNGVRIAFENCPMGGDWKRGDWNIAFNPSAWELMFDAVPSDAIGLEWEPCHQMIQLIDPLPQLRKWVKKVFHVHGKDATIYQDTVREFGIHGPERFGWHRTPGFGDTNWTDVLSELMRGGYQGTVDIEGWHDPVYCGDWEMSGQVHALRYLKGCRAEWVANPT